MGKLLYCTTQFLNMLNLFLISEIQIKVDSVLIGKGLFQKPQYINKSTLDKIIQEGLKIQ